MIRPFSFNPFIIRARQLPGLCLLILSAFQSESTAEISPEQIEFFESRIRPILAQDCYECHSTATKQKGGLNLDHRSAWEAGGDSGPVIVPGKPNESLLIQAIRHEDEDLAMPKSGAKLDDAIVNDFVRWIQIGAPDPRDQPPSPDQIAEDQDWAAVLERRKNWWSFQPIAHTTPPPSSWSHHPVDQFIEAQRDAAGLDPNPPASPTVLVRRLYFALTGLPPSADQVEEFLTAYQRNPDLAFADQVDQLLASPHFGERWARHWMDWIRYAESHGSEGDPSIGNAHVYRDYLIRALNNDVPYDQLLREHVAGDQLERPRINTELGINESLIGTAHWRMVFHGFAPTDALDEKVRFTDDQINVFSKAFLGLTVSCARCHDHKFDAISQKDYYAFFGIMGSTRPGRKAIDLPETLNRHKETLTSLKPKLRETIAKDWLSSMDLLRERLLEATDRTQNDKQKNSFLYPLHQIRNSDRGVDTLKNLLSDWKEDQAAWESHLNRDYTHRWDLGTEEDRKRWFREGTGLDQAAAAPGAFSLFGEGDLALSGIHSAGTYTHLLSSKHGGLLTSPDFNLDDDYEVWMRLKGSGRSMSRYVVYNYPRNGTVYPVREMRDNKRSWHWERYNVDYWNGDDIHLEVVTGPDAPLLVRNEKRSWFGIQEAVVVKKGTPSPPSQPRRHLAPVFAELGGNSGKEILAQALSAYTTAIGTAVKAWESNETTNDQAELLDACLQLNLLPNQVSELHASKSLLRQYRQLENEITTPTRIPTVAEWKAADQALFDRGNHKRPLDRVPRRFLEAIDSKAYQTEMSGRRELAEDLLRPDNPLTRRVIVNRVWHHLFGKGIVATPDNLGRLGSQPTHPKLLDHLAHHFSENARWSLKRLIRYLVTTRTWKMSSEPSELALSQDPSNNLYSHFSVNRLEAEAIRDSILKVSGRLNPNAFGSPVNGREPRRSVYVNVIRNRLDPFLSTFDAPVPFSAHGRRNVTTVPGQSLTMMNSDFVVSTARSWGANLARQARETSLDATIDQAWQSAFARPPRPEEHEATIDFIQQQQSDYQRFQEALSRETKALDEATSAVNSLMSTARSRIKPTDTEPSDKTPFLNPIAEWLFDEDAKDSVGALDLTLRGKAKIEDGALIVGNGESIAVSQKLTTNLRAKTMEVWVQLDTLDQAGGGAMSIQTPGGGEFDSIVYAERQAGRWMAGSNFFARTEDFGGPRESSAHKTPAHLVLTYDEKGWISAYRNGESYGDRYKSNGPLAFASGQAEVVFGIRHGYGGGGRILMGRILEARLYDRALTPEEVAAAARKESNFISQRDLLAALTTAERTAWQRTSEEVEKRKAHVARLRELAPKAGSEEVWTDLALAIFNTKEFIYVR